MRDEATTVVRMPDTAGHGTDKYGTPADSTAEAVTIADLGLSDAVLKAVKDVGYETPSAIQAATIPPLLAGRDVVGLAQTGTGKTAAFALPILSRLDVAQKTPQALVLAPTRELALQDRKSTRLNSSHVEISYAVFCLKKKKK